MAFDISGIFDCPEFVEKLVVDGADNVRVVWQPEESPDDDSYSATANQATAYVHGDDADIGYRSTIVRDGVTWTAFKAWKQGNVWTVKLAENNRRQR